MLKLVIAAAAAVCAVPAGAFTMTATFKTVATGGSLGLFYGGVDGIYPSINDLSGTTFEIGVNALTIPEDPYYHDPAKIVGGFSAVSPDVVPQVANIAYGSASYYGYSQGGVVTLTDSLFTYSFEGEQLSNNSWGRITLIADRSGVSLSNWRGSFSGSIEYRVADPAIPYDYYYDRVTFVATEAQVQINNLAGIPEPATWAMMIGGFAATGAALRGRRKLGKGARA